MLSVHCLLTNIVSLCNASSSAFVLLNSNFWFQKGFEVGGEGGGGGGVVFVFFLFLFLKLTSTVFRYCSIHKWGLKKCYKHKS